jgi:hypothetical protein
MAQHMQQALLTIQTLEMAPPFENKFSTTQMWLQTPSAAV